MSRAKKDTSTVLGIYSIEETFNMLDNNNIVITKVSQRDIPNIVVEDKLVKTNSQRYALFRENRTCVCCGRVGTYFKLITTSDNNKRAHFDLFSDDGELMTKDHIIPKSKGGKNVISNYQTMCASCNLKKGDNL